MTGEYSTSHMRLIGFALAVFFLGIPSTYCESIDFTRVTNQSSAYLSSFQDIDSYPLQPKHTLSTTPDTAHHQDIMLEAKAFLDLYKEKDKTAWSNGIVYNTPGLYSSKDRYTTHDLKAINIGTTIVLEFLTDYSWENDMTVARINFSQIPIPATAWLLGSALLGILGLRYKLSEKPV